MSGPKSSRYTLTAEQRRALQVSLEQRLVRQERARLSALLAQIENISLQAQTFSDGEKEKAAADSAHLIRQYAPLLSDSLPNDLEALAAQKEKLRSARQTVSQEIKSLNKNVKSMKTSWGKKLSHDLTQGFDATLDSALDTKRNEKQQETSQRLALLEEAAASAVREETAIQAQKLMTQFKQASSDAFRNTLFITSIQPFLKRHRMELTQYASEEADYQQLVLRYADLCQELSVPQEPQPWSPGAMKELQGLVDQLEQRWLRQEEEAYICKALDEVMQEMGYPLLGTREVIKRSGKHFRHALYTFEDGTAINVTYSDDGQIAMELGGLDDHDRIPDDQETFYLCDAMQTFCTSFAQIEEKLKQRGVILRERIHMLPPTEENAQIINTNDYQLLATPSMLEAERSIEGSQQKKRMYKDG